MVRAIGWVIAMAALPLACAPAAAQVDVSASASITTDYRFRGISQSDRDPAVQATVDVQAPSGLFAGAFVSSVDSAYQNGADAEVDLYAGYLKRFGGFHTSIGAFAYVYPGGHDINYGEVQAEIGYLLGPAEATLFAAYAPDQRNNASDNLYLGGALSGGIPTTPLTVSVKGGYEDGFYRNKLDWQAELSWSRGPFTLSVAYVDTNQTTRGVAGRLGGAGGVFAASVAF